MSWHWLVLLVVCVPSPCVPPIHRPAMLPEFGSAKMRGRLTIFASSGFASGTLMTSMLNSAVFWSSCGSLSEQPESSSPERTGPVPEP